MPLIKAAQDETLALTKRQEAVDKLNDIIPEYNAQIDATTGKYKASKKALDSYIDSLIRQYEIEGAKDKLKELGRQRADLVTQQKEAQRKVNEKQTAVNIAGSSIVNQSSNALGTSGMRNLSRGLDASSNQAKSELSEAKHNLDDIRKSLHSNMDRFER